MSIFGKLTRTLVDTVCLPVEVTIDFVSGGTTPLLTKDGKFLSERRVQSLKENFDDLLDEIDD